MRAEFDVILIPQTREKNLGSSSGRIPTKTKQTEMFRFAQHDETAIYA